MDVIHDELEDGAELSYEMSEGVAEDELTGWVMPKEKLNVFAPREAWRSKSNCMPEDVIRMLEAEGFSREDLLEQNPDQGDG